LAGPEPIDEPGQNFLSAKEQCVVTQGRLEGEKISAEILLDESRFQLTQICNPV
jgi:hypothetical protein